MSDARVFPVGNDIEQLREAVVRFQRGLPLVAVQDEDGVAEYVADAFALVAAARLVADGEVIRREDIDYEAAWERYYVLADRRNKEGLTALMLRDVIDAALHLPGDDT